MTKGRSPLTIGTTAVVLAPSRGTAFQCRCKTGPVPPPPNSVLGSAHASVFNMSFCDGSVRSINYTISEPIHRHLSNRKDGIPVDSNSY